MRLVNLEDVRAEMLEEYEMDVAAQKLYCSERLTDRGEEQYPELLREAILSHDETWLARELNRRGLIKSQEGRRNRSGGYSLVSVPVTAAETFAEGEFNRFYIRGVCKAAINAGKSSVKIYRAKSVRQPRELSSRLIGTTIEAQELLNDLRRTTSVDTVGVPGGPNSGLSVCFN